MLSARNNVENGSTGEKFPARKCLKMAILYISHVVRQLFSESQERFGSSGGQYSWVSFLRAV